MVDISVLIFMNWKVYSPFTLKKTYHIEGTFGANVRMQIAVNKLLLRSPDVKA